MISIEWRKACDCRGTASTGAVRDGGTTFDKQHDRYLTRVILIRGPSCDVCGMPWTEEAPDA